MEDLFNVRSQFGDEFGFRYIKRNINREKEKNDW